MPSVLTGISAFSALSGSKSSRKSNKLSAQQIELARERDDYNKDIVETQNQYTEDDRGYYEGRRDREEGLLDPIQEGLIARANEGPDYEGAVGRSDADVSQAYGVERGKEQRRMDRYGVNPSSGKAGSISRRLGTSEALAKVHGRNKARMQEDDRDWAKKIAVLGTGNLRGTTGPRQLTQLGAGSTSAALGDASNTQARNAAGAFGLAGKTFADSRRGGEENYFHNDDTDYYTGEG